MFAPWLALALMVPTAPVTVTEARTGKSGSTLFVVAPKMATSIATVPTLTVNGQPVPLTPGPIDADPGKPAHHGGFYAFTIGRKVSPSDVLFLDAPAGWVPEGAAIVHLPVRNYAGRLEFEIPDKKTMGLGININWLPLKPGMPYCPVKNWATRLAPWDGNTTAVDAAGYPTKLKGTRTSARFLNHVWDNPLDRTGLEPLTGPYTVIWDSDDPQTELSITSNKSAEFRVTPRPELGHRGVGGRGITHVFEVTRLGSRPGPVLFLTVSHPQGQPRFSRLWIIPPGNDAKRDDPLAVEQHTLDHLTVAPGWGPSTLRFVDSCNPWGGQSSLVDPADLAGIDRVSWCQRLRKQTVSIAQFRPVAAGAKVRTVYGDLPITDKQAFQFGSRFLVEAVTDRPHGFLTGQRVTLSGFRAPLTFTAGGVPLQIANNYASNIWVTSPISFIMVFWSRKLPKAGVFEIPTATPVVGVQATVAPVPVEVLPYEFAASMTNKFNNADMWISLPHAASEAVADAIADKILKYLAPGHRVIVEYCNEMWNFQADYGWTMGNLLGFKRGPMQSYYVKRGYDLFRRIRAKFTAAGRGGDALYCIAHQYGGNPSGMIEYAIAHKIPIDVVAFAPYIDLPRYMGRALDSWNTEQILDLVRHYMIYDSRTREIWKTYHEALDRYAAALGRRPRFYAYEGGVEQPVPTTIPTNHTARLVDAVYHPDMYDTGKVLYWMCQSRGLEVFTEYCYLCPGTPNSSWGLYHSQAQQWGRGDGRDGKAVNRMVGTTGAYPHGNVSVKGAIWRDWQADFVAGHQ